MIAAFLVAAALASDPSHCDLPVAHEQPDPSLARVFIQVAERERAAGSNETARIAYREALQHDPGNTAARRGFFETCVLIDPQAVLTAARERMSAREWDEAIVILERLRQARTYRIIDLLEGICHYQNGDDDRASPLLANARSTPQLAASADYFLGLIALRDGKGSEATLHFEQAQNSSDEKLLEQAQVLRIAAHRTGRAVISAFVEAGYNSNPSFAPNELPTQPAKPDGAGAAGLTLLWRPLGVSGPYLQAKGSYQAHIQARDRDLGVVTALAGWRLGRTASYVLGDYSFDAVLLGQAPYLYAHQLRVAGRLQLGRFGFVLPYAVKFAAYETVAAAPYSGILHAIDPEVSLRFPLGSTIALSYRLGRDFADASWTRSFEHGPSASLGIVVVPGLRLRSSGGWLQRSFDEPFVVGEVARLDNAVFVSGSSEWDVSDRFMLRLVVAHRWALSNLPSHAYTRLTTFLTLTYILGIY